MLYIANQIDSNIRELEGALIRVVAYSSLINKDINADLAAEALKDIIPSSKPKIITIQDIQQIVGQQFNVKLEDFKAKKRTKSVAFPRQIACIYLVSSQTSHYQRLAKNLGEETTPRLSMLMKRFQSWFKLIHSSKNILKKSVTL